VANYDKGTILKDLNRLDEALECLEKAIQIEPNDMDYYQNKGVVLYMMERYEEAGKCFKKVLEVRPEDERAKRALENVEKKKAGDEPGDYTGL
jgi:tetratricopeptide (TPR) repeat protein